MRQVERKSYFAHNSSTRPHDADIAQPTYVCSADKSPGRRESVPSSDLPIIRTTKGGLLGGSYSMTAGSDHSYPEQTRRTCIAGTRTKALTSAYIADKRINNCCSAGSHHRNIRTNMPSSSTEIVGTKQGNRHQTHTFLCTKNTPVVAKNMKKSKSCMVCTQHTT